MKDHDDAKVDGAHDQVSMSVSPTCLNPLADSRWDAFVDGNPRATVYQRSCWLRALSLTYNSDLFCVVTEDPRTQKIVGGMAFMPLKSLWTGRRLVSLPLTSYCDPLVDDAYILPLARYALAERPDSNSLELKLSRPPGKSLVLNDHGTWDASLSYETSILDLDRPLDQLFDALHHSCIRRKIRKAEKLGMQVGEATNDDGLRTFYALHTSVRKKHGLPPQPYRFFENMLHQLRADGYIRIPVIRYDGDIVASAIVLSTNKKQHLEYIACKQDCFSLGANQMLLWEIIKAAHSSGALELDFGRSAIDNDSLTNFKERWGAKSHQLYYYNFPASKKASERTGGNPKRELLTSLNRHLPSRLLKWEGEVLYRHIG